MLAKVPLAVDAEANFAHVCVRQGASCKELKYYHLCIKPRTCTNGMCQEHVVRESEVSLKYLNRQPPTKFEIETERTLGATDQGLTFLHCAFSNVSSNCLPKKRHSHIGCTCLIFSTVC